MQNCTKWGLQAGRAGETYAVRTKVSTADGRGCCLQPYRVAAHHVIVGENDEVGLAGGLAVY